LISLTAAESSTRRLDLRSKSSTYRPGLMQLIRTNLTSLYLQHLYAISFFCSRPGRSLTCLGYSQMIRTGSDGFTAVHRSLQYAPRCDLVCTSRLCPCLFVGPAPSSSLRLGRNRTRNSCTRSPSAWDSVAWTVPASRCCYMGPATSWPANISCSPLLYGRCTMRGFFLPHDVLHYGRLPWPLTVALPWHLTVAITVANYVVSITAITVILDEQLWGRLKKIVSILFFYAFFFYGRSSTLYTAEIKTIPFCAGAPL
ncbi:unnamed protein product, partial [Trichogramma brassicae]